MNVVTRSGPVSHTRREGYAQYLLLELLKENGYI